MVPSVRFEGGAVRRINNKKILLADYGDYGDSNDHDDYDDYDNYDNYDDYNIPK